MKVLIIHSGDPASNRGGGGAYAMYRLHLGLRKAGVDSKILSRETGVDSPYVIKFPRPPKIQQQAEHLLKKVTSRIGLNDIHLISTFGLKQHEAYLNSDIINFHGTHGAFSYLAIPALTEKKPGIFTLHDIWPFTGHCAMSYDCERWKIGCGHCPYPEAHPPIKRDNTHLEWKLKNWVYSRSNLVIVTLSSKITEQAKQSMLNRFPIYQIPNGIDTEIYEPLDPQQCRVLLDIPAHKKVLMFAALRLNQFNKGGDLLVSALKSLPDSLKNEIILLTLGHGGETIAQAAGLQALNLGYINNDRLKAIAYSAADLFVSPTRAESFGLVLLESMACGTPVVAFGVGGVPDLVRPGLTGYLAEPENFQDLARGIIQLLEDEKLREQMGISARKIAVEEFTLDLQVQRYIDLYDRVLRNDAIQPVNQLTPKLQEGHGT